MINEIIYWELYALVVSFFNGVLLAWIYDNIRAFITFSGATGHIGFYVNN